LTDGFFIGCITGTSVDGLDIALIKIKNDHIDILAAQTHSLPDDLRTDLIELGQADTVSLEHLGRCDALLGSFIGEAVAKFMAQNKIQRDEIEAIGSHGQTVRHRPDNSPAFTMQIGDPSRISEQTGITTVADFRRRDVAAGGQGAPLVPPFHRALFAGDLPVILNIGGISNVSILNDDLLGFDTGPGNCLMDSWYEVHQQAQFDTDGKWAASGEILPEKYRARILQPPLAAATPQIKLQPARRAGDFGRTDRGLYLAGTHTDFCYSKRDHRGRRWAIEFALNEPFAGNHFLRCSTQRKLRLRR
jgi:anhydro-N-acetylmuramic acid kinase